MALYREIEVFRMIMMTGSTAGAAEKLGISQPAVSQSLRRLEEEAGLELFSRVRGRLEPRREARLLMDEVDREFVGLERIEHRLHSLRQLEGASLRVACFPALGLRFMARAAARFLEESGGTSLSLNVQSSRDVFHSVSSGLADLGILADEIPVSTLVHSELWSGRAVAVMERASPLARKRKVTPEELAACPFIALSPQDSAMKQLSAVMAKRGLRLRTRAETPYSVTVCELARSGAGTGLANPLVALGFLPEGLAIRPFSEPITFRALLVFRPGTAPSSAARRFLSSVRLQLAEDEKTLRDRLKS
ncbi:MAG: LysR substrate-binding domain-containing protein [Sutterellaceae bacterium]|nr:LysR substrate-binding domain-containing protein [Sutterellaceae bacterium]MDD7441755.1 LysR substrate-binding domain-containing protein [Sutterellaceae bacterium]MDY2868545.1 LysR substrate-binding domain-containing protein [Mesosutterella sp.]